MSIVASYCITYMYTVHNSTVYMYRAAKGFFSNLGWTLSLGKSDLWSFSFSCYEHNYAKVLSLPLCQNVVPTV